MPTVVLCRPLHPSGMQLLPAGGDVSRRQLARPSASERVGVEQVDAALLSLVPDLKIVSRFGVGNDTVDVADRTRLREPPDPANPLLGPHNAAAPTECNEKMSVRAARKMPELFDGVLDPGFVVHPETLPNRRKRSGFV